MKMVDASLGQLLAEALQKTMPEHYESCIHSIESLPFSVQKRSEGQVAALRKALHGGAFGLAHGHIATATAEIANLGTLRWQLKGSRSVALLRLTSVTSFLQESKSASGIGTANAKVCGVDEAIEWATSASPQDLQSLLDVFPDAIWFAEVTPGDVLYTPAGHLSFHHVVGEDVLGYRVGVLSLGPEARTLQDIEKIIVDTRRPVEAALKEGLEVLQHWLNIPEAASFSTSCTYSL